MKTRPQDKISPIASAVDVLRADIDRIDDQILDLLEQRYPLVKRIARAKNMEHEQVLALRPEREQAIVDRLSARSAAVPEGDIRQIWRSILSLSARHQRHYRVLLWGPESARLALSTLAAARHGGTAEVEWAATAAEAIAAAADGGAILMVAEDSQPWTDWGGLELIGRHPTRCADHPWGLELGRLCAPRTKGAYAQPRVPAALSGWRERVAATGVVACLGGRGSFSEQACLRFLPGHELLATEDVASALRAVREGSADLAVVPVANSRTGAIDGHARLLSHPELRVLGEEVLQVRQHLLGLPGASRETIRRVTSHPAALAQCDAWLARWPWKRVEAASTAHAARQVAGTGDPAWAAIGSEIAATIHGLEVLAWDLQGEAANETRFAIVERRREFA